MAYLEVQQATRVYETNGTKITALRSVSLKAELGEWVVVTGRSGCGKSTLLNLCGAMDLPTEGTVRIGGQITQNLNDDGLTAIRRRLIGFIFQSFQLLHTLSVIENVEVPLLLAGEKNTRMRARERLAWVELADYADRLPHQLSGGEQQRVAIARALVHDPRVLLADEPTGNLDSATGEIVLKTLGRVSRELGTLVLMATHSSEAASLAGRIVHLRDGKVAEEHQAVN